MNRLVLDVSNNNPISTDSLRVAKPAMLVCKATEGITFQDSTLGLHRLTAHSLGIPFGSFLFLHPMTHGNEADYYLHYAKPRPDEMVVVDVEVTDGYGMDVVAHRAISCLHFLAVNLPQSPVLYCSASWFLEMIKPAYQEPIDSVTFAKAIEMLENNMKLLHPFMPFLTEEIWQLLAERTAEEALIVSTWPEMKPFNAQLIADFENTIDVISGIRTIRKDKNIPFKDTIELKVVNNDKASTYFDSVVTKLGNITSLEYVSDKVDGALSFRVKSNEYFIPITGSISGSQQCCLGHN